MPRATLDELLTFANEIREAGGGNPIDAIMPAIPMDSQQCLIAKNLNFNCKVSGSNEGSGWTMWFADDKELRDKISEKISLVPDYRWNPEDDCHDFGVILPDEIGQIAADFDSLFRDVRDEMIYDKESDLLPYIEQSVLEAQGIGTFNDKGQLVL